MSAVGDLLARMLLALDDHEWEIVAACLDDTVRRDYRSLTGAEPDELPGPALAAEWRAVLEGLTGHQHLLGPAVVDEEGDSARASLHVIGTHTLEGDPGSPWTVGGTYRFALRRDGERWRVAAMTLDVRWQTGDAALLGRAAG
jgi:hypothetical protein